MCFLYTKWCVCVWIKPNAHIVLAFSTQTNLLNILIELIVFHSNRICEYEASNWERISASSFLNNKNLNFVGVSISLGVFPESNRWAKKEIDIHHNVVERFIINLLRMLILANTTFITNNVHFVFIFIFFICLPFIILLYIHYT